MSFYKKNANGEFIPVEISEVISKGWNNKLVLVRVGTDDNPAPESELEDVIETLDNTVVLRMLPNTSFMVTSYALTFDLIPLEDLKKQCVAVRVTGGDDLDKLADLKKDAQRELRGKTKKIVFLPTPLSVEEYHELMQIKKRCDLRRSRRG